MDETMKRKLDKVLEDVKDPQSNLPLSSLGIIRKYRYNKELKELYVFSDFISHRPACSTCAGISMMIESTIKRDLKSALEKELPSLSVIFV